MTIKKYAKTINNLSKKYPNAKVVFATDEGAEDIHPIVYKPEAGYIKSGRFKSETKRNKVNVICIN